MYYVDIQDGKIVAKNEIKTTAELAPNQKEISQELFGQLQVPAIFEVDGQENIISFTPIAVDPLVVSEPVDEEKIMLAEAVITLTNEIEQLKARLQTLEGSTN